MDFDWKSTLGVVAPGIATALGGPLAGLATKALLSVFGLGAGASDQEVAQAVQGATPEQLLALKKADQEFAVQMKSLDIDLEKIAAGDRDSARRRQVETKDWVPGALGLLTVAGFFIVLTIMAWGLVSQSVTKSEAFLIMLGALTAMTKDIYSYFFGSSASSRTKDATIANLSK